jgi:cytochrome c oxidase accessory protein FixG
MKLDSAPWSISKLAKRIAKHASWVLIAIATGGAWIFYFADAPTLLMNFLTGQAPTVAYATVGVLTATTYVFGGLMREQVCIYMCPWPRIQAAMLDEDSLVVTYNEWRGEPRSHGSKKALAQGLSSGDCVDCNACVAVCPTGIDIRNGQQMECITCALCIDACDNIMDRLEKPRGLIAYSTLRDYNHNMALAMDPATGTIAPARIRDTAGSFVKDVRHFDWHIFFRARTLLYITLWCVIGIGMLYFLLTRDRLKLEVLHDRNPVSVVLSDGSVRNGFSVKLSNMLSEPRTFILSLDGLPGATMTVAEMKDATGKSIAIEVEADKLRSVHVFVTQPAQLTNVGQTAFIFNVTDPQSFSSAKYNAQFDVTGQNQ